MKKEEGRRKKEEGRRKKEEEPIISFFWCGATERVNPMEVKLWKRTYHLDQLNIFLRLPFPSRLQYNECKICTH
ncbi:TPA: hypothetical protein ACOEDB_000820 [Enterobacter hormaechei subsp. xiangfangensis]